MKLLVAGIVILMSYAVVLMQFYSAAKKGCNSTADAVLKNKPLAILNRRHLISLIAMAVAAIYTGFTNWHWLWLRPVTGAGLLTVVGGVAAVLVSRRAAQQALKDSVAVRTASPETYLLLRALFLMLYEIFFRGILLQVCLAWTSVAIAILINVVLYAGAHSFSTRQELIGTVPFGLLLCGLTLYSGSVFPAILLHLLLGLPYDLYILFTPRPATKTFVS